MLRKVLRPMLGRQVLGIHIALILLAFGSIEPKARGEAPGRAYTSRTDLPNLHVNALAQDSLGYIWVGTANGLCRDKGNDYDIFSSDKSDPSTIP
ncbi:MAG: hypothetical protein K2L78_03250, partial [Muribaculaceae bacterium]|nr:hypothetical protein [Muribaculaceae bacterium]